MLPNFDRTGLKLWACLLVGLLGAIFVGNLLGEEGEYGAIKVAVAAGISLFFFTSYTWWWVPIPAMFALGGFLYFGFKMYLFEVGMVLCVIPLLVASALKPSSVLQKRGRLPVRFWLTAVFIGVHAMWSVFLARYYREGGFTNILRQYSFAEWGIIFCCIFYWCGSTRFLRRALVFFFVAYLIRVVVGLVNFYFPVFLYLPGVNYVLPMLSDDLRAAGLGLAAVAICYASLASFWMARFFHVIIAIIAGASVFMGGGRTAAVLVLFLPLFLALIKRKISWLVGSAALVICFVAFLNIFSPQVAMLDSRVQRALSPLLLDRSGAAFSVQTESSDIWHQRLREVAISRWLDNPVSFLFGNRIKRFDPLKFLQTGIATYDFDSALDQAMDLATYESGWFTVLSGAGLVGGVLFVSVLVLLLRSSLARLIKRGLNDVTGAFCFLASYNILVWLVFGWTTGGWPSYEIMLGTIAYGACLDENRAPKSSSNLQNTGFRRRDVGRLAAVPSVG
jgi:hypothetical protein